MDGLGETLRLQADAIDRMTAIRAELAIANAAGREVATLEQKLDAMRSTSPYRIEDARAIEEGLTRARAQRATRERLRIDEATQLLLLEGLRSALEGKGYKKISLPLLANVEIATPCPANWAEMQGDTDVRFCSECQKDVFNLSMMSTEEAQATLLASKSSSMCIRFFRRTDGTILTQDCPVALRQRRFWRRTAGIAAAGLLAAALGLGYSTFIEMKCKTGTDGVAGNMSGQ